MIDRKRDVRVRLGVAVLLIAGGCTVTPAIVPPEVPAALRPPSTEVPFLEARASGVQVYECAARAGQTPEYGWTFRAPEAVLADRSGRALGKHYAGPTWESVDGSSVVGDVKARDPGPAASAIPWLLLGAKSTAGSGLLSATTSIQRVQTSGGVAPSATCGAANAAQVVRVPYSATYYFYRAAR